MIKKLFIILSGVLVMMYTSPAYADDLTVEILTVTDEVLFNGASSSKIQNNSSAGRKELQIYATHDASQYDSTGAGIHLYGNDDLKHNGSCTILTGPDDAGAARLIVTKNGSVCIGTGLMNLVDDNEQIGQLHINKPVGKPAIYIAGASTSEGDISFKYGEYLSIGTHDGVEFDEIVQIRYNGDFILNGVCINKKIEYFEQKIEDLEQRLELLESYP